MRNRLETAMVAIIALGAGGCVVTPQSNYDGPPPAYYSAPAPYAANTDDYYWIDLADGFADAIGTSPPDYSFRWANATAWAWVGISGETLLIERAADGDIQYFFEPGAVTPYLVRDAFRSFAFDRGVLVAIHDRNGTIIADNSRPRDRQDGDALLRRAVELMAASRQRQWDNSSAGLWYGSFGYDYIINTGWTHSWRSRPDWNDHRRRPYPDWRGRHLDDERRWRRDHADRTRDWHRRGGRGAPPRMVVTPQPSPPPVITAPPSGPTAPVIGRRPPRNQVDPPGGPVGVVRQPPVAADVGDDGAIRDPARRPGRGPARGRIDDTEPGEMMPMPLPDAANAPQRRQIPPAARQRPPAAAPVMITPPVETPAAVAPPVRRAPPPAMERPARVPAPVAAPEPAPTYAPPAFVPPPRVERPAPPPAAAPAPERYQPAERSAPTPPVAAPPPPAPAPRVSEQPRVRNNSIDDDGTRPD